MYVPALGATLEVNVTFVPRQTRLPDVESVGVVGRAPTVSITLSILATQVPLVIRQRRVTGAPGNKPVIVVVGLLGFVMVAVPATICHTPVRTGGVLAAIVVVVPHTF